MFRAIVVMIMSVLLLTPSLHAAPINSYDWITRDRIRGAYLSSGDLNDGLAKAKASGLNLLMPKFGGLQAPPTEANIKLLRDWGDKCRQLGIHLMPVYNFRGGGAEALLSDRREVTAAGDTMERTPCPLDEAFWSKYIYGRAVFLAEHAGELGLSGAIIDPEMYGADHTCFTTLCYCADCMREFGAKVGRTIPADLAASQRASWLKEQGLEKAFEQHYADRVKEYSQKIERDVHAKTPDFILGVLLLDYPLVFNRAMAMGLGTETRPVLGFSETTYSPGYTEYVLKQQETFAALPAHVLMVPGLWQQQFPAENLAEQYYTCAVNSSGYWIYTLESMLEDVSRLPGYQLREPHERYWEAIRVANAELTKWAASGGKYVSGLKVRDFEPPLPVLTAGDVKIEALVAAPDAAPHSMGPVTAPRLRYRNPLFVIGKANEPVTAKISNCRLANYRPGTQWIVVGPDRTLLKEGHMKAGESQEVTFTPPTGGVYLVLAQSGQNSHTVEVLTGQSCGFLASKEHPFTVNGQFGRMYLYVPAGVDKFSLFVKAEGQAAGRGGKLSLYGPDGKLAATLAGDLGKQTEMPVQATPEQQGRVWCLSVEDVTNDLLLHLSARIPPYLSPDFAKVVTVKATAPR